ncbi:MAG: Txe/YoeB family addiction module toxin [Actinobacteria bacterium]|nr:Txe/YoeB family addiction module toxin [Actinomycetota bacterium]
MTATAIEDLAYWQMNNPKTVQRVNAILESILIDPERGIGKLENLKYELAGAWSRRINHRDRMVYQVHGNTIIVLQLRDRY